MRALLLRLHPPVYLLAMLLAGTTLFLVWPDQQAIWWLCLPCAISMPILGLSLILWAALQYLRQGNPIRPTDWPKTLITSGPFRFLRHPIYVGMGILLATPLFALGAMAYAPGLLAFTLIIRAVFIPLEEARLQQVFGYRYEEYQRQVRW